MRCPACTALCRIRAWSLGGWCRDRHGRIAKTRPPGAPPLWLLQLRREEGGDRLVRAMLTQLQAHREDYWVEWIISGALCCAVLGLATLCTHCAEALGGKAGPA